MDSNLPLDKTAVSNGQIDLLPPMHKAAFDEVAKAWPNAFIHDRASEVMLTLEACNLVVRVGLAKTGEGLWTLSTNGLMRKTRERC